MKNMKDLSNGYSGKYGLDEKKNTKKAVISAIRKNVAGLLEELSPSMS